MKEKIVLDTNILLESPEILYDGELYTYVIPAIVLKELDELKKKRPELRYSVSLAARHILKNIHKIQVDFHNYQSSLNDESIIDITDKEGGILYTSDLIMTILAIKRNVDVENPIAFIDEGYTGYVELDINDLSEELVNKLYEKNRTNLSKNLVNNHLAEIVHPNEYLIINAGEDYFVYKFEEKLDVYVKCKKLNNVKIKPKDAKQYIAVHSAISDVPLTIIDGVVGSGKTLTAIASAMYRIEQGLSKKIYISRPPLPIDRRYDIGFLPGSAEEKLSGWVGGILSNLEFLYGDDAERIFNEHFKHFPIHQAQGYSIHDAVLIVDEAQLLTVDIAKQVMSRIAHNSKLILVGDEEQAYNINTKAESGFRAIKQKLPSENVEYVKLEKVYRGALAELSLKI